MNLIEFCIRKPAFTIVMSLVLTVVGWIGYTHLPVRWIPDVNLPFVSVTTNYPGASASLVESQITTPIENALAGVDGIDTLSSRSKEGQSSIDLNFKFGHNLNAAVEDIRGAVQRINSELPTGSKSPVIAKADNANSIPILYLAFSDQHRSDKEVSDYVKQFILPRVQTVDGVAGVVTYGERVSALHIWLDPIKMAAANVTVDDINRVLTEQNVQVPSGQIRSTARYYTVITNETLNSAEEFNHLIIRHDDTNTVRLRDVGTAVVDAANNDTSFRVQGHPAIAVGIIAQTNANPLEVAKKVKKEFAVITKNLPVGMQGNIVFDQSIYIEASVKHVYHSVLEAIFLVLVVIYLFLANMRAAMIPILTIPICLIGTFAVMDWFGFSINTITLIAFVLAIGLVVDDAIVMLENIMRHIEQGLTPVAAAMKGGREIIFPIIAMTLTLAAVYAPIAMVSGILGSIFKEFALTLAVTVIISGFVALTLSPMMCARVLRKQLSHSNYENWLTGFIDRLKKTYSSVLGTVLQKRKWVVITLVLIGGLGYLLFKNLPMSLVPDEDMDQVNVFMAAPRNASYQYTNGYANRLESKYASLPYVDSYLADVGTWSPSRSFQILNLVPRQQRKQTAMEIAENLNKEFQQLPGVDVSVYPEESPLAWSAGSEGANVAMEVMSSSDYKDLHGLMQHMQEAAKKSKVFSKVNSKLKWDGEQFELKIDREKVADMKIPMVNITNTISTLLAGRTMGHFEYGGNQYDVILKMNNEALSNPNVINQLFVRNLNNKMVSLADLVSVSETTSPEMLPHFERMRSDTLYATLNPGYTVADGVHALQVISKDVLPDYAKYSFTGAARNFLDSNGQMGTMFLLALVFIYLILVAQFESFIDPLIILFTVPFAMIGGLILLKLSGGSLNIYSDIGLVTLIGLIAKHGILITEFANRLRGLGRSVQEAVLEAAVARLRPILMTTAAMVLGALPLALASGAGSETRHQIGWVIVGGLLFGTFFSLFVVPVAYSFLARFRSFSMAPTMMMDSGL